MTQWLYDRIISLLVPLALFRLWWKGRLNPAYRQRWGERLGWDLPTKPCMIWFHTVSVGETVAAAPLIAAIIQKFPEHRVMVTCTTPTGSERIHNLFGDQIEHAYLPWDRSRVLRQWLAVLQPRVLVIMETELWPNLLAESHLRGVFVMLANARLSERSAQGYARWPGLVRPMLANLDYVAAQDQATAQRFVHLGVDPSRVGVLGSLKFDAIRPALNRETLREQRTGAKNPVLVAASTHPGEELLVLSAFSVVQATLPDALLVLVPRHFERGSEVAGLLNRQHMAWQLRSQMQSLNTDTHVILVDTMGELMQWYALADIAFVGGSLLPHLGGHNVLEPLSLDIPTISGPYVTNFQSIVEELVQEGGLMLCEADRLGDTWNDLLRHPARSQEMVCAANRVLDRNRGSLQRHLDLISNALKQQCIR